MLNISQLFKKAKYVNNLYTWLCITFTKHMIYIAQNFFFLFPTRKSFAHDNMKTTLGLEKKGGKTLRS